MSKKIYFLIVLLLVFVFLPRPQKILIEDTLDKVIYFIKEKIQNGTSNSPPDSPSEQGAKLTKSLNYVKELDKSEASQNQDPHRFRK